MQGGRGSRGEGREREIGWMRKRIDGNGESSGAVKTMNRVPDAGQTYRLNRGLYGVCLHVSHSL